jgi:hypothetical protein
LLDLAGFVRIDHSVLHGHHADPLVAFDTHCARI